MGLISNEYPGLKVTEYDIISDSCLNGWGFGNIAATALDVAKYYFEYFGSENLISYESAAKMMNFEYMDSKSFNITYGVGLTPMVFPSANNISSPNHPYPNFPENELIGHAGEDWGSGAQLVGYNFAHKFSIMTSIDSNMGLNCSLKNNDFMQNWQGPGGLYCK